MLKRMEAKHPEWIAALVDRIDQKEFDRIVLIKELDVDSWWYRELFFGPTISTAIERNYVLQQTVAGYYIYEPIAAPADEAAG